MSSKINETQKIKKQTGIIQIIFTVISFIIFLLIYCSIMLNTLNPPYLSGLILIIPTAVFSILTFCVRHNLLKNWIANILTLIISVCSIFLTLILIISFVCVHSVYTTTDISKYKKILKTNSSNSLINHFPKSIPKEAEDIKLFYTPRLLHGDEEFFVKFRIDSDYIEEEIKNASKSSSWNGHILKDINEQFLCKTYRLLDTTFTSVGYGNNEITGSPFGITEPMKDVRDLEIFILNKESTKIINGSYSYVHGIAIDKKENSIIYFEKAS